MAKFTYLNNSGYDLTIPNIGIVKKGETISLAFPISNVNLVEVENKPTKAAVKSPKKEVKK